MSLRWEGAVGLDLGRSFIGWVESPEGYESGYHGTHVAGIAGGIMDNYLGRAGTAQACMTPVRVLASYAGLHSWIANGITYSANQDADVISMSLGGGGYAQTMADAVS